MELRQLRYFVRAVELGSIGRAALDLGLVQSALSQQISKLESELSTRLMYRTGKGAVPTEAGVAFFREAQLTLRHAEQAARVAREARLSGTVSVGFAPTTASVLAIPFMRAMKERYPDIRLHMVEGMSGHLTSMLNARSLDLAILFNAHTALRWSLTPLLEEKLFLIRSRDRGAQAAAPNPRSVQTEDLAHLPLILPTGTHGLRHVIESAFTRANVVPKVVAEIDSLSILMEAVDAGFGNAIQPGAAIGRWKDADERFSLSPLADEEARRSNALCSLSDDELSPAALAARIVLTDSARALVMSGQWPGAVLPNADPTPSAAHSRIIDRHRNS